MSCDTKGSRYRVIDVCGNGSGGEVFRAIHEQTGDHVALKRVKHDAEEDALNEMRHLWMFKSNENIVDIFGAARDKGGSLYVSLGLCKTSLYSVLQSMRRLPPRRVINGVVSMLANAIDAMHEKEICHGDIKPGNVLIDDRGSAKLCDFGNAVRENCEAKPTTRWYRSPEMLFRQKKARKESDMWSLGVLVAEMMTREALLPGKSDIEQTTLTVELLGRPEGKALDYFKELPDFHKFTFHSVDVQGIGLKEWLAMCSLLDGEDRKALTELVASLVQLDPRMRPRARWISDSMSGSGEHDKAAVVNVMEEAFSRKQSEFPTIGSSCL